jgi:hypothetical protein
LSVPSINSTPIGNATASTGAFTTLSSSGATTMTAGTASTSTATGTLVVTGGVGVSGTVSSGNVSVDSNIDVASGNVNIASGNVNVDNGDLRASSVLVGGGLFNTGLNLPTDVWSSGKIMVRSELITFKQGDVAVAGSYNLFEVPQGYMFFVNTMEVIITGFDLGDSDVGSVGPPNISFSSYDDSRSGDPTIIHHGPALTTNMSLGSRHIIESPLDGIAQGSMFSFNLIDGFTSNGSDDIITGYAVATGYLLRIAPGEYDEYNEEC